MSLTRSEENNNPTKQTQLELELFGGPATLAIEDEPFNFDNNNEPAAHLPASVTRTQSLFSLPSSSPHKTDAPAINLRRSR